MPVVDEAKSSLTSLDYIPLVVRRQSLQTVLACPVFQKNPRLSALLEYLCVRADVPESESPKEFTIATDVFGRTADFDSSTDSIVRVEMHRLRKKLREFYDGPGQHEPCQIILEAGCYRPRFQYVALPPATALTLAPIALTIHSPRPRPRRVLYWTLALCVLACLSAGYFLRGRRAPSREVEAAVPPSILAADSRGTVRILCGAGAGSIHRSLRADWGPDRYFSGGAPTETSAPFLFRTVRPGLYQTARTGEFRYDIPLPAGTYELRLHFSEHNRNLRDPLDGSENTRIFNVVANGTLILQGFDIAADASLNTADTRVFRDIHPSRDGKLHLVFSRVSDVPLLNAIEITPGQPGALNPVRIVAQSEGLTDAAGLRWSADGFFLHGRSLNHGHSERANKDSDVSVIDAERYGNFSYAIPVAPGRYTAKLHFLEAFWGPSSPGGGGVGSRLFDVYCNGQILWKNLDVYREGGSQELVKTATGLEPNAQGKLMLSFVPVKNYAMVSAIEILDEFQPVSH